jgi:hypothetical protein
MQGAVFWWYLIMPRTRKVKQVASERRCVQSVSLVCRAGWSKLFNVAATNSFHAGVVPKARARINPSYTFGLLLSHGGRPKAIIQQCCWVASCHRAIHIFRRLWARPRESKGRDHIARHLLLHLRDRPSGVHHYLQHRPVVGSPRAIPLFCPWNRIYDHEGFRSCPHPPPT